MITEGDPPQSNRIQGRRCSGLARREGKSPISVTFCLILSHSALGCEAVRDTSEIERGTLAEARYDEARKRQNETLLSRLSPGRAGFRQAQGEREGPYVGQLPSWGHYSTRGRAVCSWPSRTTVIGLMVVIGISGVVGWFPGPWWCTSLVKQGPDIKDWLSALSTRPGMHSRVRGNAGGGGVGTGERPYHSSFRHPLSGLLQWSKIVRVRRSSR